jgi:F0F1-type ATP synthase assembly protein I
LFDLSAKRELNKGFGDALSNAVELAVTPSVFALIGWWLDERLGTGPFLLIGLFVFTMGYVVWKLWTGYERRMQQQEREVLDPRPQR